MVTCDYCGEESIHVPIVEKPVRFFLGDNVHLSVQAFTDLKEGKIRDLICIECLSQELEAIRSSL